LHVFHYDNLGNAMSNGREPTSCLDWIFNFKLGGFAPEESKCMVQMLELLELKTVPGCVL
jgi:hypothetical protein